MKAIKNYFYTASYQLLSIIIPMITAPYISRTLGPSGVGINAFTYSLLSYFLLIANLGINYYGNREIAFVRNNGEKLVKTFWEIQFLRLFTVLGSIFLFYGFTYFYHSYHIYLILQSINLIAVFFDISWLYVGLEDFKLLLLRNLVIKFIFLFLIFICVRNQSDLQIYIIIIGLSTLLGNVSLWPYLAKKLPKKRKIEVLKLRPFRHFLPMLGLFIPTVASQLYIELNKTMLGAMINTNASGFYTYSDNIIKMILTLITSAGTVMLPRVANLLSSGRKKAANNMLYITFDITSLIAVPLAFGIFIVAPEFSLMFYGNRYIEVGYAMQYECPLIIFVTWSSIIGMQYLIPLKKEKWFATSSLLGATTNVILNFPLIMIYGLKGAIVATVISELIVSLYQICKIKHMIDLKKLFHNLPKYIIASLLMFISLYLFKLILHFSYFVNILIEALFGVVVYSMFIFFLKPTSLDLLMKGRD